MNIQASGLLSLFSGLDGLENIQQSLLQDGVLPEQFASALLEQIELLQQGQSEIVLPVQQHADLSQLQNFAGVIGKDLPGMLNQVDIDLEETLQALADVLKNIDGIDVDEERLNSQALLTNVKAELSVDNFEDFEEIEQGTVLAPADNDEQVVAVASQQAPTLLDVLQEQEAVKQAAVLVNSMDEELPETLEKNVMQLADNVAKNSPVSALDKGEKESVLSVAENNSGTMTEQESDFRGTEKEALLNTEKKPADGEMADRKNLDVGAEKSLPKITAELAMLNRTIASENKAEMPAMTRHFAHPEWGKEFSEKVIWMHKQAVPSAELNLNPRHLGPITIRVDVNQDQTSIAFTAQHAAVKEAIEAALPRLREMLGTQQLNLLDVNVSQQQSEQKQSQGFFQMAGDQNGQSEKEHVDEEDLENVRSDTMISVADEIEAGRAIASKGILSIFA